MQMVMVLDFLSVVGLIVLFAALVIRAGASVWNGGHILISGCFVAKADLRAQDNCSDNSSRFNLTF